MSQAATKYIRSAIHNGNPYKLQKAATLLNKQIVTTNTLSGIFSTLIKQDRQNEIKNLFKLQRLAEPEITPCYPLINVLKKTVLSKTEQPPPTIQQTLDKTIFENNDWDDNDKDILCIAYLEMNRNNSQEPTTKLEKYFLEQCLAKKNKWPKPYVQALLKHVNQNFPDLTIQATFWASAQIVDNFLEDETNKLVQKATKDPQKIAEIFTELISHKWEKHRLFARSGLKKLNEETKNNFRIHPLLSETTAKNSKRLHTLFRGIL